MGFILRAGQGIRLAVIVAKYRSVGLSGGARAPRPTEAGNDIPNEYLPVGAPCQAFLVRPQFRDSGRIKAPLCNGGSHRRWVGDCLSCCTEYSCDKNNPTATRFASLTLVAPPFTQGRQDNDRLRQNNRVITRYFSLYTREARYCPQCDFKWLIADMGHI